jgi:hypothetical protein
MDALAIRVRDNLRKYSKISLESSGRFHGVETSPSTELNRQTIEKHNAMTTLSFETTVRAPSNDAPRSVATHFLILLPLTLVASMFCVKANAIGVPGIHWDGSFFASVPLHLARGDGWQHSPYITTQFLENDASLSFPGHGALTPFIYGRIFGCSQIETLVRYMAHVNTLTFFTWFLSFSVANRFTIKSILNCSLVASAAASLAIQTQGRPEHLAPLFVCPACAIWARGDRGLLSLFAWSITSGVLFCTSPLLGVLCGMTTTFVIGCITVKTLVFFKRTLLLGGSAFSSLLVSFAIENVCRGTLLNEWIAINIKWRAFGSPLWGYLVSYGRDSLLGHSITLPLWNWMFFLYTLAAAFFLLTNRSYLFFALFAMLFSYVIRVVHDYGVAAMLPVITTIAYSSGCSGIVRKCLCGIPLGSCLLALCITVFQTWSVAENGITRSATREAIISLTGNEYPIIYHGIYRPSYWDLQPVEGRWVSISLGRTVNPARDVEVSAIKNLYGRPVRYAVLPQTYRGIPPAKLYWGSTEYQLFFSNWTVSRVYFLGIPLPSRVPGYNFALYKASTSSESPEPAEP